jgi:fructosamine-3-kinase
MTLPVALEDAVRPYLDGGTVRAEPLGGGCIAHACRVSTERRSYFLKWGGEEVARTFAPEALGLRALRRAESPLEVPEVLAVEASTPGGPGFLLASWVEAGRPGKDFWERFGTGLAALHRHAEERYGFASDNFIGRLPQRNTWASSWPGFFRGSRLEPQVALARENNAWRRSWDAPMERLLARLPDLLPSAPPPSVLHGDLWRGNFLPTASGTAALIDPAVYYGHRETDLAMTELFGGFDARFYDAYKAAWPLEPGYAERRVVYNLYHLINHLNHFGQGYAGQVEAGLRRFG